MKPIYKLVNELYSSSFQNSSNTTLSAEPVDQPVHTGQPGICVPIFLMLTWGNSTEGNYNLPFAGGTDDDYQGLKLITKRIKPQ